MQLQSLLLAHYRTRGNYIAKAAKESVDVVNMSSEGDREELLDLGRTESIDIIVAIDTDATVVVGKQLQYLLHRRCRPDRRVGCARVESDQKISST